MTLSSLRGADTGSAVARLRARKSLADISPSVNAPPAVTSFPEPERRQAPQWLQTLRGLVVGLFVGLLFVTVFVPLPDPKPQVQLDDEKATASNFSRRSPSYVRTPHETCAPPEYVRERAGVLRNRCVTILAATEESVVARVTLHPPPVAGDTAVVSVALSGRTQGVPYGSQSFMASGDSAMIELEYSANGLVPDVDYVVLVTLVSNASGWQESTKLICREAFSTLRLDGNLIRNSGFEQPGDPPHLATQFHPKNGNGARAWTPFYNGGLHIACGAIETGGNDREDSNYSEVDLHYLQPRSGLCCAQFGYRGKAEQQNQLSPMSATQVPQFYGAHQAVSVPDAVNSVLIGAWIHVSLGTPPPRQDAESAGDSLSMAVGWQLNDGSVVDAIFIPLGDEPGQERGAWRYVCAVVLADKSTALRIVHVFFHFHDRVAGSLFVDDVSVSPFGFENPDNVNRTTGCHVLMAQARNETFGGRPDPACRGSLDLQASIRPSDKQLTLAVPLTADRVLRLEAISRLYGGGPVTAAVLVRDEKELTMFVHIWNLKPWLRNHVDVTLVHLSHQTLRNEQIPINALRNAAIRLAQTEFVMMLDVDMTPATGSFACFRDPDGTMLSGLMPEDGSRIFTVPVFMADVHVQPALNKFDLLNQLNHRVATTYCLTSQKATKVDKWYRSLNPYETRFTTDYEPYGICRRDKHPAFDERFVGYGFNKISWAFYAERGTKARLFVLSDSFVTHLNHVDNAWVSGISVAHYLRTWRRYFAFVAETEASHAPLDPVYIQPRM
jgi:Glycosyl-transferase for dystroglycan